MPIETTPAVPVSLMVGENWIAIVVAAIAFYAIGFVIYGAVFSKLWMQLSGYTKEQLAPHTWKMALSPIMPILTAIGLALVMRAAAIDNLNSGLMLALIVYGLLILPTRLYSFVYSPEKPGLLAMDAIHLFLGTMAAGAIIAAWP